LEEFGNVITSGGSGVVIAITPLEKDELTEPRGDGHRRMIDLCPVGRAGTMRSVRWLHS
jgi:hypothetical protein